MRFTGRNQLPCYESDDAPALSLQYNESMRILDAAALVEADGTLSPDLIADGTITEPKLAAGAASSRVIADGAVGTVELADGAATEPKIAAGAVTSGKIASGAVTSDKIAGGVIPEIPSHADVLELKGGALQKGGSPVEGFEVKPSDAAHYVKIGVASDESATVYASGAGSLVIGSDAEGGYIGAVGQELAKINGSPLSKYINPVSMVQYYGGNFHSGVSNDVVSYVDLVGGGGSTHAYIGGGSDDASVLLRHTAYDDKCSFYVTRQGAGIGKGEGGDELKFINGQTLDEFVQAHQAQGGASPENTVTEGANGFLQSGGANLGRVRLAAKDLGQIEVSAAETSEYDYLSNAAGFQVVKGDAGTSALTLKYVDASSTSKSFKISNGKNGVEIGNSVVPVTTINGQTLDEFVQSHQAQGGAAPENALVYNDNEPWPTYGSDSTPAAWLGASSADGDSFVAVQSKDKGASNAEIEIQEAGASFPIGATAEGGYIGDSGRELVKINGMGVREFVEQFVPEQPPIPEVTAPQLQRGTVAQQFADKLTVSPVPVWQTGADTPRPRFGAMTLQSIGGSGLGSAVDINANTPFLNDLQLAKNSTFTGLLVKTRSDGSISTSWVTLKVDDTGKSLMFTSAVSVPANTTAIVYIFEE